MGDLDNTQDAGWTHLPADLAQVTLTAPGGVPQGGECKLLQVVRTPS